MSALKINIPLGIGDIIYIKAQLEAHKAKYSSIEICPAFHLIEHYRNNKQDYRHFVNAILKILFDEPPYKIVYDKKYPFMELGSQGIWANYKLEPQRPRLAHRLCKGIPLDIPKYYVMTTKIRELPRKIYEKIRPEIMPVLAAMSKRHPIVILGERQVGMNNEYQIHGSANIYSIYDDLIKIPNIIDKTIPELGLTTPDIVQFQQDCLIMSKAERIISLGVGGNFCMATAVGEVIGYRTDSYVVADKLYNNRKYGDTVITKNYEQFLNLLKSIK